VTIAGADEAARKKAIAARDSWLADLRKKAAAYPRELADQQLLAEAECRSGNGSFCVAAADRALSLSANDPVSLTWKGYGLTLEAVEAPPAERESLLADARAAIARANRFDTESVLPLLAYYRSYALAGEPAPDVAIDGLAKSLDEVPSAPTTRLMLGTALVNHADPIDARRILLPLADGAFDPPEKPKAQQLLTGITPKPLAANDAGRKAR
jgi:predicted Zn-dependent protease